MMNYKLKPLPLHPRIHKTPMTKKKQIPFATVWKFLLSALLCFS